MVRSSPSAKESLAGSSLERWFEDGETWTYYVVSLRTYI